MARSMLRAAALAAGSFAMVGAAAAQQPDWLVDPAPFAARVERAADGSAVTLANGLVARRVRIADGGAGTVAFDDLVAGSSLLRATQPEATLTLDGVEHRLGGYGGQAVRNYLTAAAEAALRPDPTAWRCVGHGERAVRAPFPWRPRREWLADARSWPPAGVGYALEFAPPAGGPAVTATVVYELYDGVPLLMKRLELRNAGDPPVRLDAFAAELLALDLRLAGIAPGQAVALRDVTPGSGEAPALRVQAAADGRLLAPVRVPVRGFRADTLR